MQGIRILKSLIRQARDHILSELSRVRVPPEFMSTTVPCGKMDEVRG